MANTKNFALRLQVIDPMLRRPGGVTLKEMMDACNERLAQEPAEDGRPQPRVTAVNTIHNDIVAIARIYSAPIISEKRGKPEYFWYSDPNFSVYKVALTRDELNGLEKVLGMLGRLDGLPQFQWASEMSAHLRASFYHMESGGDPVISFDSDPNYRGTQWLNRLYDCVLHQEVAMITYHEFNQPDTLLHLFSPWFLKQYRHRWYVFGHTNRQEGIKRLALDRIEKLSINTSLPYQPNTDIDFAHYFDDIIGVDHIDNGGPQEIQFRIPLYQAPWLDTEPLHPTQHRIAEDASTVTYALTVGINHEVLQMLLAYSQYVEVLAPADLREYFAYIHSTALDKYEGFFDWDAHQREVEEEEGRG